ncbi:MAG: L,D-transpeptidase/peptidoglycan binding protein [Butyrivibrio sp.]|uniref:L,D-transpeptidase family protein n=1 Tax=Butyrivibrio sp. TaxID=28121 RepID=UPI0025EB993D|nr:L,D-transpeptidase family protein [Butyrivibrio sp.]MCR5770169.1 L,D-transpeptidase/peptidoglycan binding protein [Butyrivibrio sp.]
MKTIIKWLSGIFIVIVIMTALAYMALAVYYHDHFVFGTWARGHYITGLSVSQAAELLNEEYETADLTVKDKEGKKYEINAEDIGVKADFTASLQTAFDRQNVVSWIVNTISGKELTMVPEITYDEDALEKAVSLWPLFDLKEEDRTIEIVNVAYEGYQLIDTMDDVPVYDEILKQVDIAVRSGVGELDLENFDSCYKDLELTDKMESVKKTYEKISKLQDTGIVYKFGSQEIEFDGSFISDAIVTEEQLEDMSSQKTRKSEPGSGEFISGGEEVSFPKSYSIENGFIVDYAGNLILSESALYESMQELCGQYDTVGAARSFISNDGDTIKVNGGTYGNKIDNDKEFEYLISSILSGTKETHEPFYEQLAAEQGTDDIGDTYVEISIDDQHLYYYKDGELVLDCDIVTGNVKLGRDTPTGVYYVYGKAKNRYLRGRGYVSFVKFWMPVYKGVGIHDASWRDEFGGDIYTDSGSHGCINLPSDKAEELYGYVEVGTPVVIY